MHLPPTARLLAPAADVAVAVGVVEPDEAAPGSSDSGEHCVLAGDFHRAEFAVQLVSDYLVVWALSELGHLGWVG